MLERIKKIVVISGLFVLSSFAAEAQTTSLQISVMIMPRPCEFPESCEPVAQSVPTQVNVDNGVISYVGFLPEVKMTDDLLTVIF